ncbi:ABC transporter permease, partial [Variovorax sp. CT11-76]
LWRTGVLAAAAWLALGLLTLLWPNKPIGFSDWNFTEEFGYATLVIAAGFLVIALLGPRAGRVARTLRPAGQWLVASALPVLVQHVDQALRRRE